MPLNQLCPLINSANVKKRRNRIDSETNLLNVKM